MQQIKCASCEYTKFFVNSIAETIFISCCECGASFVTGTPKTEPVQQEPELVEEPKPEFVEEPEEIDESEIEDVQEGKASKEEFEKATGEKVQEPNPAAVKLTLEQKQALLKKMEEESADAIKKAMNKQGSNSKWQG